jgi:hypothetical protein
MNVRRIKKLFDYPYTAVEFADASKRWGCNCGPAALATMLGLKPDDVLPHVPRFAERQYTNPTMMAAALKSLGVAWHERDDSDCGGRTLTKYGLCRIQFEGPWTAPGANPKWAYRQTHWIGSAELLTNSIGEHMHCWVFDINAGWQPVEDWERDTLPKIVATYPRANGGWSCTHRWELDLP